MSILLDSDNVGGYTVSMMTTQTAHAADMMTTYTLISAKHSETIKGTREEAIARAIAIEAEYQPAFGVSVEEVESGFTVAEIRDGAVEEDI